MKLYSATLAMCFFVFGSVLAQQKQNDDIFKYPDVLKFNLSQTGEPNSIIFKNSTQIRPSQVDMLFNRILKVSKEDDMRLLSSKEDHLGFKHDKYTQYYNNIQVEFATYIIHSKNGKVTSMRGDYFNVKGVKTNPNISNIAAFNAAIGHVNAKAYIWDNEAEAEVLEYQKPTGELVIFPVMSKINDVPRLAFKFDIYAQEPVYRADVYIDALTGEFIFENKKIHHVDVSASGQSLYNGNVSFTADNLSGSYRLRQSVDGGGIQTFDMNNGTNYGSASDITSNSTSFNSPTGVQAHFGAEQTHKYFSQEHARNSYNGNGAVIRSYVSYNNNYVNAFWDGSRMTYGDGDGVNYGPLVSVDIVGHEITHGVTEYAANLVYSYQSGALNESFSDIFGESIEKFATGTNDWLMGDDIGAGGSGGALRSMSNPNIYGDPDTYLGTNWYSGSGDNGGVHYNSGVQNFWFYLLTVGGSGTNDIGDAYSVSSIGMNKAAAIAYRNLTVYLTTNSQYSDARNGAIQSAIDLYGSGSIEEIATTNAWYAVGVGEAYVQTCALTAPAGLTASNITDNGFVIEWSNVSGAVSYTVTINGSTDIVAGLSYNASGLIAGTDYNVMVQANCSPGDSGVSSSISLTTTGTTPLVYCNSSSSNINDEYIGRVQLNSIDNSSGAQFYTDFTGISTTLMEGTEHTLTVTPIWTGTIYSEGYAVWIDYNKDGDFADSGELVWSQSPTQTTPVNGSFIVPESAVNGATRMRVSMKYNGVPSSCESFTYGEVEDYTVVIESAGPDTTAPVLVLNGASVINLEQGSSYTEQGATASDNIDGDITSSITIGGDTVNTSVVGTYNVVYSVSDTAGNSSQETRTVNVSADATIPVITLIGSSEVNINVGDVYSDAGATAQDNFDGDLTNDIVTNNSVDTSVAGSYTVTYNVNDAAGNSANEVVRSVNVLEPSLGCMSGISSFPYLEGFENSLGGWTQASNDDINWSINSNGTASNNTGPNSAAQGAYYIYVEASGNGTGYPNKLATLNSPCFDLTDLTQANFNFQYHMYGSSDMGTINLELSDDDGATWSSLWSQSGNQGNQWLSVEVNLNAFTGKGVQLRFNRLVGGTWQADIAIDNLGLTGLGEPDTTAPVLVLNGASVINLEQGSSYTEQGATASDNIDGDITSSITIGGDTVNTSVVGTYNVVYSVSDTAGNSSQETRTVNVSADATIPVITLIGSSEVNINVGDVYSDAGATAQDNFDGDLTNDIVTNNSVDTSVAGSYTVTYNVNDAAGNSANEVVRLINVSVQPTGPVVLNEGYFESGWDGWSDGGSDCARRANSSYSYENNYSIRIRDNSGVGSSMTLSNVDLSPYAQVEVDFYFYVRSMENNEDFWLRYYNGSNWTTVATWTRGTDIENNTFYNATIVLSASQFNFANNSGFRFQNDASGNNDQIWIDQVTISGISSTSTIQNSIIPLGTGNTGFASNESDFEDLDVVIYPNPVSGNNLNVVLLDYNGIYYRVMNMLGQTVDSGQLKNRQVNVENLESGMYFIEINDGEEVFIKKFIRR